MRKSLVILLATLYGLSLTVAFDVTGNAALALTLTLLAILGALLLGEIWRSFAVVKTFPSGDVNVRRSRKQLERLASTVTAAAKGYPYSQWDVAHILRRALLDKSAGSEAYPAYWARTEEGRERILEILGVNSDLMDVLEPPEDISPEHRFFPNRSKHSVEYFSKLDRVLALLESTR
jgi:hypothetical protein